MTELYSSKEEENELVNKFAVRMKESLSRERAQKRTWKETSVIHLLLRLQTQVRRLDDILDHKCVQNPEVLNKEKIHLVNEALRHCVNIANYAAMIHDNLNR